MNKLSSSEKMLLYILLLVATCVICIWFILMPSFRHYQDLQEKLRRVQDEKQNIQMQLAQGKGLEEKIHEVIEKAELEKQPFLTVENKEIYQRWLMDVARKTGLKVERLSLTNPSPQSVVPYISRPNNMTYPIGEYYNAMLNNTTEDKDPVDEQPQKQPSKEEQVIQVRFDIEIEGTQAQVITFVDTLATSTRHIVVETLPLPDFEQVSDEKRVTLAISIYGIHKEDDGTFEAFRF